MRTGRITGRRRRSQIHCSKERALLRLVVGVLPFGGSIRLIDVSKDLKFNLRHAENVWPQAGVAAPIGLRGFRRHAGDVGKRSSNASS